MRMLGSCPRRTATGVLHNGPDNKSFRLDKAEVDKGPTIWSHSVMFTLVILRAMVSFDFEVLLAK